MGSDVTSAALAEEKVVRPCVRDAEDIRQARRMVGIEGLDLEDILSDAPAVVPQKPLLADPVVGWATAVVIGAPPQEVEHVLTVRTEDAAIVGLREIALGHPPHMSKAVGDAQPIHRHPCCW